MAARRVQSPGISVLVPFVLACAQQDGNAAPTPRQFVEREFAEASWDTVTLVAGNEEDTVLFDPGPGTSADGYLYVFDYGDRRVKSFDPFGRLKWAFGRSGRGPGEFVNVVDLRVAPDGQIWALDAGTGRTIVLTPDGELRAHLRPPAQMSLMRLLLLEGDTLAIPLVEGDTFWVRFDSIRIREFGRYDDAELASAQSLVRQTLVAISADRREWAAVFPFADRFVVYDGERFRCKGDLVKGTSPALTLAPGQTPPIWAAGIALMDSAVLILARDRGTPDDLAVLDEFSPDCKYLRSYRLPGRRRSIAGAGQILYLQVDDPAPGFVAVRWRTHR